MINDAALPTTGSTFRQQALLKTNRFDLLPNGATAPLGSWQTYTVGLNAATWDLSNSDFATLMQNVTAIRINVEALWGSEIQGIDNVRLASASVGVVPEPASLIMLTSGFFGLAIAVKRKHRR